MKKIITLASIVIASISLNSCGGLGSTGSTVGTNQGTAAIGGANAGSLLTSVLSGTGTNVLGTVLGTLLGGYTASAQSLVGTWTYTQPKVVFESNSILAQLGSSVASSKLESTLEKQLSKMGFKAGKSTLTLNQDKTCVLALSGKTLNGTYNYDTGSKILTITGALGMTNVSCTCTMNAGQLFMLFDADKLLSVATSMSSMSSTTSTLSSLLGNYNGLKLGWAMGRQ